MVAAYLGLRALWNHRRRIVIGGLLVVGFVGFGGFWLRVHAKPSHKRISPPRSASRLAPLSPSTTTSARKILVPERLVDSLAIRAEGDRWRLEIWRPRHHEDETGFVLDSAEEFVKFFRNDRLLRTSTAGEIGPGYSLEFGRPSFATRFPLIAIRVEPECGNPCAIDLFSIRHGRIIEIGSVGGEAGGPIFRDLDGDGKPEWILDDYDHYAFTGKPTHFLVYKEASDGTLTLWKRLPNKKRQRLPAALGLERWDM
jgi:hypothetical protein